MEHNPMFHVEIRNEYEDNSLLGLNLMEEYKSLLHDTKSKGIRGVTQPVEENSLTGWTNGVMPYSIGVWCCSNGVWLD
jgi:hypothetical protein